MYACRKPDEELERGHADVQQERADRDDRRVLCSAYAVSSASAVSRMWPAIMLARSRTASEKGRTRKSCTNSIGRHEDVQRPWARPAGTGGR